MTVTQEQTSVGERVKANRKLLGYTQERLATEANVSVGLVRAVEQGRAPASQAFVAAVARALKLSTAELQGTYPRGNRDQEQVHAGIPEIRRELAAYRLPPEDVPVRAYDDLAADVAKASKLRHGVKLAELGAMLPGVLHDLRVAWWSTPNGPEQERVFGLLAEAYAATSQVVYKLGYIDLSSLAVDRYEWAAAQSGDELAVLVGDYQRAGEMICAADWAGAERYLEGSRRRIEDQLGGGDPKVLSTWGNLHLKSALAAARAGRRDTADDHLAEAMETAKRIGHDRDDYRLCFGPTNVAIWSVGLAVEGLDGTEAVKRSQLVQLPQGTPRERAGHHYIDLARGFLLHGDREGAFSALRIAKKIAPAQTRYHPMVHETIRMLARQEARATETVRGFAAWCGITSID